MGVHATGRAIKAFHRRCIRLMIAQSDKPLINPSPSSMGFMQRYLDKFLSLTMFDDLNVSEGAGYAILHLRKASSCPLTGGM
jgi:hypothetical protein